MKLNVKHFIVFITVFMLFLIGIGSNSFASSITTRNIADKINSSEVVTKWKTDNYYDVTAQSTDDSLTLVIKQDKYE